MNIPQFSVERKVTTTMITLIVVVLGLLSLHYLGLEMMPDIDYPQITVGTIWRGASPEDVEELVTKPLEDAVSTVKNVKTVSSVSLESFSILTVEFEWGTNLDFAAEDIRNVIGQIKQFLPEGVDEPNVIKFDMSQMPILGYVATGLDDTEKLRKLIDDVVANRIERIDGVATVMPMGGLIREIAVEIDRAKLESYGLDIQQVVRALQFQNLNLPAGNLTQRHSDYLIRTVGEFESLDEIRDTVVGATRTGQPIRVRDIAVVRDTHRTVRNYGRAQKKPTVFLMVAKESGANTVEVSDAVKKEIKRLEKQLGAVKFMKVTDQGEITERLLNRTANTGIIGGILAMLFMWLFLRSWRPTLIIGLAIPLSIIATFIAVYLMGYTLNFMTMVGMVLGVGMLVDNAVVVIENIFRHQEEEKKDPNTAAKDGATEVGMAITASTLTTVAVFLPLALQKGMTGELSRGIALTVGFSLFASLFVALTIVPMFASILIRPRTNHASQRAATGGRLFSAFREQYAKVLAWVLNHRAITVLILLVTFGISLAIVPLIGTEFMPKTDMPMLIMKLRMPVGTSLDETDRIVRVLEDKFMKLPGVKVVSAFVGPEESDLAGVGMGVNPSDVNEAMLWVRLEYKENRKHSVWELMDMIREQIPPLVGLEYEFIDMGKVMMGKEMKPVDIKIFGDDIDTLKRIGRQVLEAIKDVKGLHDLDLSIKAGKPEYTIRIDRDKAASYGLTIGQIAMAMRTATIGSVAGRYHEAGEEIDIRVKLKESDRDSRKALELLPLATPTGKRIPLKAVAKIVPRRGPIRIEREEHSRLAHVSANLSGRDLGSVVKEIKERLKPIQRTLPAGYVIKFGGEYEDMIDTFKELAFAFFVALLLVYMIMASQFESFLYPFIIMFTLPMAIIGANFALLFTGRTLSLVSGMGFIMLAGIIVNNGIVFVDYTNRLRHKGLSVYDALITAGKVRLRPILITALTTIFGMLPMAIDTTQGSENRSAIAITVIGGLVVGTALTLLVLPVLYSLFSRERKPIASQPETASPIPPTPPTPADEPAH